ncbi:NAD(P)H-binding protein [Vibrio sp. RC27]
MSKVAIVIGATGLVGNALVQQLSTDDSFHKIVCITRRPILINDGKIVNQVIDFDNLEQHASLFSGDFLFSCLGTTRHQAGSIDAQKKVDIDYQLKAARLAAKNGVTQYLLVSSAGANSRSKSPYLKMKGELEDQIASLPFERIAIVQPSALLGYRETPRISEKIGGWILPILTSIPPLKKYRPITGFQVAAKLINISQQQTQRFERFQLDELFNIEIR